MMYCKTISGDIFKVWSDNTDEKTMHVYPADEEFSADSTTCEEIRYDEIKSKAREISQLN